VLHSHRNDEISRRVALSGATAPPDGVTDGQCFTAYAQQVLAATLRSGDIVIFGNLPVCEDAAVLEIVQAAGAALRFFCPFAGPAPPNHQR
jgi:hypothetical protein